MATNRKGALILYFAIFGFLVGIAFYFTIQFSEKPADIDFNIGENAVGVLAASKEARKLSIFIETAAQYAAEQTMHDLAAQGGYLEHSCDTHSGLIVWNSDSSPCFPTRKRLHQQITAAFDTNFYPYINNFDRLDIPEDNYNYFINDQTTNLEFFGIASQDYPLEIMRGSITAREKEQIGIYYLKPSFKVTISGNIIKDFETAIEDARDILEQVNACETDSAAPAEFPTCLEAAITTINEKSDLNWEIDCNENDENTEDRIIPFCTYTKKKYYTFETEESKLTNKQATIQFALNFPV